MRGVEVLVLDEADRMLDMGFIHDVKRIMEKLPKDKQINCPPKVGFGMEIQAITITTTIIIITIRILIISVLILIMIIII